MKPLHTASLFLGLALGILLTTLSFSIQRAVAADSKEEVISQEELDKNLDSILQDQKQLKERIDSIVTQTQFLKASSGK